MEELLRVEDGVTGPSLRRLVARSADWSAMRGSVGGEEEGWVGCAGVCEGCGVVVLAWVCEGGGWEERLGIRVGYWRFGALAAALEAVEPILEGKSVEGEIERGG